MKVSVYGVNEGYAGFGHVIVNLINALAEHPIELDLVTHSSGLPDAERVVPSVHRTVIGAGHVPRGTDLARYLRRYNPDIVLCDANREKNNRRVLFAQAAAKSRARIVFRLGVSLPAMVAQRNAFNAFLYKLSIRHSFRRADMVIVNSVGVQEDLLRTVHVSPENVRLIRNSTVSPMIEAMASEPVADSWLNQSAEPTIVAAGRLRKVKDFETLIRAFHLVNDARPCRLLILGDGPERVPLEKLVNSLRLEYAVRFAGQIANPYPFFKRAQLLVLSSRSEGSPNVLIEALALGVPVVSTDCRNGPREILQDGRYGPLVAVGDHRALAHAIIETLAQPAAPEILKQAVGEYRASVAAASYMQVFSGIMRSGDSEQ